MTKLLTKIERLVLDIDGVLTTGQMLYDDTGKKYKIFGPHDKDGLKIINKYIDDVVFITADRTGFDISYARLVKDWKIDPSKLILVSEEGRMKWFEDNCNFETTAFMGDGYHDAPILQKVKIGIVPNSARIEAKQAATYVTESIAGNGAVLDACLYLQKVINGSI